MSIMARRRQANRIAPEVKVVGDTVALPQQTPVQPDPAPELLSEEPAEDQKPLVAAEKPKGKKNKGA